MQNFLKNIVHVYMLVDQNLCFIQMEKKRRSVLILIYKQYFDSLKNIGSTTVKFTLACFMSQVPGGYLYKYKKWLRKRKM